MTYTPPEVVAQNIVDYVAKNTGSNLNFKICDSTSAFSGCTYIKLTGVEQLNWDQIKYIRHGCEKYGWEITDNQSDSIRLEKM